VRAVGEIIAQDVGMSAKVFQLVNSAFFGAPKHISSPSRAVMFLGLNTIKALATAVCVFRQFDPATAERFNLSGLWNHSVEVGALAKRIVQLEGVPPQVADHALLAGLLHDVGKLVFAAELEDDYAEVQESARSNATAIQDVEKEVLGATHADVGAYLLGLWGFAPPVVEAALYHHRPLASPAQEFSPLTAVHVGNALLHEAGPAVGVPLDSQIDIAYLTHLELDGRLEAWHQLGPEPLFSE
jgi:putative nucleotidyltransferase with HDIG domain